jgi:hypothetical protein
VVDASRWIMALHSSSHAPSARKTGVFLVGQISGGFVAVRCEKTRQKINASLRGVRRAFLAPSRRRPPPVRRVRLLSRRCHRVCAHYRQMCASSGRYYLVI